MALIHPWAVQCVGWENKKVKEEEKKINGKGTDVVKRRKEGGRDVMGRRSVVHGCMFTKGYGAIEGWGLSTYVWSCS